MPELKVLFLLQENTTAMSLQNYVIPLSGIILFFNGKTTVFDGGNGKKAMPVSFAHEFKN